MAFSGAFIKPFRPAFDAGLAAAAGNGLLNNLVAYWALDEAAGANNALDKHSNGLTLTHAASPGSAAGIVYSGARTFNGSTQYFSRASETLLQAGDNDVTFAVWVFRTGTPAGNKPILAKAETAFSIGYYIDYSLSSTRYRFVVTSDGTTEKVIAANNFGSPGADAWHLIACWHDATANTINISINDGAANSTGHATGIYAGTSPFVFGKDFLNRYWTGSIGPVAMWKSAAGAGGCLTATQRSQLYNSGAGLAYAAFTT